MFQSYTHLLSSILDTIPNVHQEISIYYNYKQSVFNTIFQSVNTRNYCGIETEIVK